MLIHSIPVFTLIFNLPIPLLDIYIHFLVCNLATVVLQQPNIFILQHLQLGQIQMYTQYSNLIELHVILSGHPEFPQSLGIIYLIHIIRISC